MLVDYDNQLGMAWYAVRTRSNFEQQAVAEIADKGFEAYLPAFQQVHQWKDRKKIVNHPLFPGYFFVRLVDSNERRLAVLKTAGVVQILGSGKTIEPVPEEQVESVRRMLSANVACFAHPFLREGSRVRIRRGALKDLEGLLVRFKNAYRLVLSVDLLCQSVATEVDIIDIEALGYPGAGRQRIA
jgi:transcription antitermination factor NusG